MIEHFYQNIHGYFTFPDFYTWAVGELTNLECPRVVEVGVHSGQSAAFLGVELANRCQRPRLWLVDNGMDVAFVTASLGPIVEACSAQMLRANSVDAAATFANHTLDMVYIDANHTYADVTADIEAWMPKLKPNGILAGHDFTLEIPDVIRAVTDKFEMLAVFRGIKYDGKYFPTWVVRK